MRNGKFIKEWEPDAQGHSADKKSLAWFFCDLIHLPGKEVHTYATLSLCRSKKNTGPLLHCVGIVDQIQIVRLGYMSSTSKRRALKELFCQPWWLILRILTLGKLRQEDDSEFRTTLNYRMRLCKKKTVF